MKPISIDKRYINMLLVYGLILTSGTLIHNNYQKELTLLLFAGCMAVLVLYLKKFDPRFLLYLTTTFLILFSIHLYTDGSLPLTSILGTMITMITAYIILMMVKDDFIDAYLRVIVLLAAISLFGYLTDRYFLFDGAIRLLPQIAGNTYEGFLYAFRFMPHIERNNSIFFEPGVYQGFLNAGLYMIFFTETRLSAKRKQVYSLILVLALFSTFSTAGFAIFALMLVYILAKSKLISRSYKIAVVAIIAVLVSIFSDRVQHTVVEKLSRYTESATLQEGIEERRTFDALVDIEIFKSDIFGQGYDRYEGLFNRYSRFYESPYLRNFDPRQGAPVLNLGGSSNGITKIFAVYGLAFSLFIFCSYYYFFHRFIPDPILRILSFVMLLMFFNGEVFVLMPISLALIAAIFVYDGKRSPKTSEVIQRETRRDLSKPGLE